MRPQRSSLRRRVRALMAIECRIEYVNGYTIDDLGTRVPQWVTTYAGPCWLRPLDRSFDQVNSAGISATLSTYELWLPTEAAIPPKLAPEARAVITAATGDQTLAGSNFHIEGAIQDDWQTARRLAVKRVN